ncbi:MAG: VCBS repeat-containing protein, partial [Halioglobus sp.]
MRELKWLPSSFLSTSTQITLMLGTVMDTKDRNDRDISTERLFDTEVAKDKRLVDEEEQTIVGATRSEELSLQNIFIDKGEESADDGEAPVERADFAQAVEVDLKSDADNVGVQARDTHQGSESDAVIINTGDGGRTFEETDSGSGSFSTPLENIDNSAALVGVQVGGQEEVFPAGSPHDSVDLVEGIDDTPIVNTAPVAGPDITTTVAEADSSISGRLSSFDADEGAIVSFGIAGGAAAPAGFTMNADGFYSFDPADEAYDHLNVGDSQVVTIPVTVTDDQGATDTSQIQITVTGTNDAPIAGANISSS